MYLGVVANAVPSKGFDGKIFLKRVSKEVQYQQMNHCQNFSDNATINGLIKNGEWKDPISGLITEGMRLGDLKESLAITYNLEQSIVDRLVIKYGVTGKPKYIVNDNDLVPTQDELDIGNYQLKIRHVKGDKREIDVSCDSEFMKKTMPEVGESIRNAYHWVPYETPIFLYLDNAGGHGKLEVVDQYVKDLEEKWNVRCIHQRPRSPATNMLDLGVWMALQNVVEKLHFQKRRRRILCRRQLQKGGVTWIVPS